MDNSKEGIVIVSMSNLFHIFDKERTIEIKKYKLNKAITTISKRGYKGLNNNLITEHSHNDDKNPIISESSDKSQKKEEGYTITKKRK